ncbi:hypothetical protein KY331_02350 [Candidatus Woesearchaeota archaeon]|nr:hypothetical protein [Candidatus Woesearchaeota archaeon]
MANELGFLGGAGKAPAKKKKGISLFGGKKAAPAGPSIPDVLEQLNDVGTRISLLEDRSTNLSRRTQVTDSNILNLRKRIDDEIKTINSDLVEIRRSVTEMTNKIDLIIKELKTRAGKEDVEVIRKYVDMWEPLNFVTREEVEKLIRSMVGEK